MKKGEKKKDGKTIDRHYRFSPKDFNRIRLLAAHYAGGDVTKWITYAALNAERRHLK